MSEEAEDSDSCDMVVRIRGLPYSATKQEIADFFSGLCVPPDLLTLSHQMIPSSDAHIICLYVHYPL